MSAVDASIALYTAELNVRINNAAPHAEIELHTSLFVSVRIEEVDVFSYSCKPKIPKEMEDTAFIKDYRRRVHEDQDSTTTQSVALLTGMQTNDICIVVPLVIHGCVRLNQRSTWEKMS